MVAMPVAMLALAAACGTATDGQAKPAGDGPSNPGSSQGSGSGSTLPHSGAPKVPNPLNSAILRNAQQDPCSTLTTTQVQKLRLNTRGEFKNAEAGPSCSWSNVEAGSSVLVYFLTKVVYQGLSQIYETKDNTDFFYAMAPVQGFPVVASGSVDLRSSEGDCPVQVGVTDKQVMQVDVTVSRAKRGQLEPCETARQVAGMVLTTMKGGA